MARTRGARDADYDAKRAALLARVRERLARPDAPPASFRELAAAAGVSETTLRHYFGRRDDVIVAVLAAFLAEGAPHLARMAEPAGPFPASVRAAAADLAAGQRSAALRRLHALGVAEGVRSGVVGPAYVRLILEPSLAAVRRRLDAHVARGEMRPADMRAAALALVAPVHAAVQHQADLGGAAEFPLDLDAFVAAHADAFVRAYRADPAR